MYLIYKLLKVDQQSQNSPISKWLAFTLYKLVLDQDRTNFLKEIIIKFLNVFTYL